MMRVPLKGLGESKLERLVWLSDKSQELIPEMRGSILEGKMMDFIFCCIITRAAFGVHLLLSPPFLMVILITGFE